MRWKYALIPLLALVAILSWSGCQAVIFSIRYPSLVADAKKRLETVSQRLPTARGSVLVEHVDTTAGGQMLECEGRVLEELYGTNELSFVEVLEFYTVSLQPAGWLPKLPTDRGRSFALGDEFHLEVSDNYNVSLIGVAAINEGQSRFRTIYSLRLSTPVVLPFPSHCREG